MGVVPVNHLNTCPEDVAGDSSEDTCLSLEMMETRMIDGAVREEHGLKFFDPLRSPDEEMMKMEVGNE